MNYEVEIDFLLLLSPPIMYVVIYIGLHSDLHCSSQLMTYGSSSGEGPN